jgi:ProP effector
MTDISKPKRHPRPAATHTSRSTAARAAHPLQATLAGLYPTLFGAQPRPLKRGIFQDLLAAHPDTLPSETLKAALSEHTRSGAYLNAVASGSHRYDLAGNPVEPLATEHVVHALLEVFRRRQNRSAQDLGPQLVQRLAAVYETSGLSRDAFAALAPTRQERAQQWFDAALDMAAQHAAKSVALRRAFGNSGLSLEAFASQYGLSLAEAQRVLAPAAPALH